MKFQPLHDRLIVKADAAAETSKGGMLLPDSAQEIPSQGIVLACGKGRIDSNGVPYPMTVKAEDHILYGKYSGTPIDLNGEEVLIMRESDVFAVVVDEPPV